MVTKSGKTKNSDKKRLSKGWRTHVRRMKQEARKSGSDQNKSPRSPRPAVETK
jgi:hypothetical protein